MSSDDVKTLVAVLAPLAKKMRIDKTALKGARGVSWTSDRLTYDLLAAHVNGGPARGLCPIREGESTTMVACLDFDSHRGETPWSEMTETAERVSDALRASGYEPTPFRSTGGSGIHLIVQWVEPQDAYSVRMAMRMALAACGLFDGAGGVAAQCVEVFPKQDEVAQGDFGSMFILPLAGKSVPLDPVFGLEPMAQLDAQNLTWPNSTPVPVIEKPVRNVNQFSEPEPLERVRSALFAIPNDRREYQWFHRLYCAVHEALGGSDEARDLVNEWSAQASWHNLRFNDAKVWRYLKDPSRRNGRAITRASLFHEAGLHGWGAAPAPDAEGFEDVSDEEVEAAQAAGFEVAVVERGAEAGLRLDAKERWKKAILDAPDEAVLVRDVLPRLVLDTVLGGTERGMLAEVLKGKLTDMGSKVGIGDCRRMVKPPRPKKGEAKTHWSDGWVYVTDEDSFYRLDSDELLSMQGFNARFNRELPRREDDPMPRTAAWTVLEDMRIPTVTRRIYLPWAQGTFDMDGVACANRFRPSSMPAKATHYTPAGRKVIEAIQTHISLICGGRARVAAILLSWVAWQVQNPGRKVRWAPLIKGIPGDGKTLFGRLVAAAIGECNVKEVSPKVLGTDFTDWAHGACVGVLEEIRLTGHSRYDIFNAIKPYVTNNTVEIHPKGAAPFNTINTMNYIAFTNHSDALPLDEVDRRWFIVFSKFTHIDQMTAVVGDVDAYFNVLYDGLENNRDEIAKWLAEYQLSPEFQANGRAPNTDEKEVMVALSSSGEEDAITEAINRGGKGVGKKALSFSALISALQQGESAVEMRGNDVARVLVKLGWVKVPKQVWWQDQARKVWVRGLGIHDTAEIRAELDGTLANKSVDPNFAESCRLFD